MLQAENSVWFRGPRGRGRDRLSIVLVCTGNSAVAPVVVGFAVTWSTAQSAFSAV
jgi:hypothetical protein